MVHSQKGRGVVVAPPAPSISIFICFRVSETPLLAVGRKTHSPFDSRNHRRLVKAYSSGGGYHRPVPPGNCLKYARQLVPCAYPASCPSGQPLAQDRPCENPAPFW